MYKKEDNTHNIKVPNESEEALKKYFAECFNKNGEFDFEKFQQRLATNEINFYKESYGLDWLGKSYARLLANDSATTLLSEDEVFNAKPENTDSENLLIKGDNLEVLKHLSNAYYEQVKMIYIDPPYNTGSDGFIYADDRHFTAEQLQTLAGVDDNKARRILAFTQSKSNSHSAWLTFMYPRLYIARQMMRNDGVIFVSIDDNEMPQLRLLMDEIFGEVNFVSQFIWKKKQGGANDSSYVVAEHEYILCYAKNYSLTKFGIDVTYKLDDKLYPYKDDKGDYGLITLDKASIQFSQSLVYKITGPDGTTYSPRIVNGKQSCWRWSKSKVKKDYDELVFKNDKIYTKYYRPKGITPKSLLIDSLYGRIESGNDDIKALFGFSPFNYPKPVSLMRHLITISTDSDDLILDFFAGSGTTADAVMQLNAEDGGNRKFILVQLPEKVNQKKNKATYDFIKNDLHVDEPTIFEITKERLIRTAKKIKEKEKDMFNAGHKPDLGFKIFETTPIWEGYDFEADRLDGQMELFDDRSLTDDDMKTLLTTWKTHDGMPLTERMHEMKFYGYTGYYGRNKLYLMNKGFNSDNLISLLQTINADKDFNPHTIIAFGYHFESKMLIELAESVKSFTNKKNIDIDFITRY
jgi:adenine-specific DNA-methyltransferase